MALDRIYKSGHTSSVDNHASNPDGNLTEEPVQTSFVSHSGFLKLIEKYFENSHLDARYDWHNIGFKSFEIIARDWNYMCGIQQEFVLRETDDSR